MDESPAYAPNKEQPMNRSDVLAQISAIQRPLDRVALGLVSNHTRKRVIGASGKKQEERTELLEALDRLVSRR